MNVIKTLFGYLMPLWYIVFGMTSEYFGIENNAYYATVSYVMGMISIMLITELEQ